MFTLQVDEEISLQLIQLHHKEELYQLVDSNREHLREWLPWVDSTNDASNYDTIIPAWLTQFAENNGFQAGIRYKGKFVGMIGLHSIDWNNKATSIGYYLASEAEGNGVMTRSVHRVLQYIFEELNLQRVEIRCGENNVKSQAIPERLGFTKEGLIRDGEKLYDHFHSLIVYGKLRSEWSNNN